MVTLVIRSKRTSTPTIRLARKTFISWSKKIFSQSKPYIEKIGPNIPSTLSKICNSIDKKDNDYTCQVLEDSSAGKIHEREVSPPRLTRSRLSHFLAAWKVCFNFWTRKHHFAWILNYIIIPSTLVALLVLQVWKNGGSDWTATETLVLETRLAYLKIGLLVWEGINWAAYLGRHKLGCVFGRA